MDIPRYTQVLLEAIETDYSSERYLEDDLATNFPRVPEVVCHLKLLRAFAVYKERILEGETGNDATKKWQVFITVAVRRFIIWISGLKSYLKPENVMARQCKKQVKKREKADASPNVDLARSHSRTKPVAEPPEAASVPEIISEHRLFSVGSTKHIPFINAFGDHLPPLDVAMVWHAFLLTPRSFYDTFLHHSFLFFANYPFPLLALTQRISDTDFAYRPEEYYVERFQDILERVGYIREPYSIDEFSVDVVHFDVFCPQCHMKIVNQVPATTKSGIGYTDAGFAVTAMPCQCSFSLDLDHDEIRKRQLHADAVSKSTLPGVFKYFSKVLTSSLPSAIEPMQWDAKLKQMITGQLTPKVSKLDFIKMLRHIQSEVNHRQLSKVLKLYPMMNLISATVPGDVVVWEDLVGAIFRHERFMDTINGLDLLCADDIAEFAAESISRYKRFFHLAVHADGGTLLVPTLDIDLVWHTHQLSHYYYVRDCLRSGRRVVVDHDDKVDQGRLDTQYGHTARVYFNQFKEEYSECRCNYCTHKRSRAPASKLRQIFRSHTHQKPPKIKVPGTEKIKGHRKQNSQSSLRSVSSQQTSSSSPRQSSSSTPTPPASETATATHVSFHNAIELPSAAAQRHLKSIEQKLGDDVPWHHEEETTPFVVSPTKPVNARCAQLFGPGLCVTTIDILDEPQPPKPGWRWRPTPDN
ncbi:hypothetical protein DIURU_000640 [Diutina rugosa]|uniref:Uncharacterized protein n=1 Tax=Diutina rugosa TaxID=5481 RepID=A0A642UXS8_DIURU|nr:uncharacterized protein DIURU_000640 [Diutina rugosa]KAA8907320.1 hypothetical protein DIURU_000640 [Diutina rugosa]